MVDSTPTLWDLVPDGQLGWLFVEFPEFSAVREDYFKTDEGYAGLQAALAQAPESGDVIPGCGGLRKARWADPRRGRGKRGGLRIIYFLVPEVRVIAMVDVYDKDEADDLTPKEKSELAALARKVKQKLVRQWDGSKGRQS